MDQASSSSSFQIAQLNDSLFEVCRPLSTPSMQVLFFHGFQYLRNEGDHLQTWESGDGSCIWPATWLVEEFPEAHILFVSYNAGVMRNRKTGNVDVYIIAENLVSDLLQANIGQVQGCPVVLVGHSFGGLVIKEVCLHLGTRQLNGDARGSRFLEGVRGIFFYATPHHGTGDRFVEVAVSCMQSPLLEYVGTLSTPAARLHFHFDNLCKIYKTWRIAGLAESLPTKVGLLPSFIVVPEAAARYGPSFNVVDGADHFSICQPMTKTSRSFNALTSLLDEISGDSKRRERDQDLQYLPESIVGIDHVLEKVKGKLEKASGLGLAGMGGIGKTTLAKALFNSMRPHFEYTCFIKDVKKLNILVREKLLEDMHPQLGIEKGGGGLASLKGKKVLLILDDVASEKDLEIVPMLVNQFDVHKDSRFVATSRDFELLSVYLDEVHLVSFLTPQQSKHLFLSYAFRTRVPPEVPPSFRGYTDVVVGKCGGLPLTLEVVGKYLHKKSEVIWMQAIEALDKAKTVVGLDEKLWAKLKLSYDGLDKMEQDLFLDAATVLYNCDLDLAKTLWSTTTDGSQEMVWQHLVDLSLVWESKDALGTTRIDVHEQLRSLGRKIALTPGENGLRFWAEDEDGERQAWKLLLAQDYSVDTVKDIVALKLGRFSQPHSFREYFDEGISTTRMQSYIQRSILCKMEKLRYLVLRDVDIDQTPGDLLPSTLTLLHWHSTNLPNLPFNPSFQKHLTVLKLNFTELYMIPDTFGQLSSLRKLELNCQNLKRLPDSFGSLKVLQILKLSTCLSLEGLPETIGNLAALEELHLLSCIALSTLPTSLGHLAMLKKLKIASCDSLKKLPKTLGGLVILEDFWLQGCKSLCVLPDSLGHLLELKRLRISSCDSLKKLPKTLAGLVNVVDFVLQDCNALRVLPDSLGHMRMLKKMAIIRCHFLEKIPETFGDLVNLEDLCLQSCHGLSYLPNSLGCLLRLKKVEIEDCDLLDELPTGKILGRLVALKELLLRKHKVRSSFPRTLSSLKTFLELQTIPNSTRCSARGSNSMSFHGHRLGFYSQNSRGVHKKQVNFYDKMQEPSKNGMRRVCFKKGDKFWEVEKELLEKEDILEVEPGEKLDEEEAEDPLLLTKEEEDECEYLEREWKSLTDLIENLKNLK